MLLLHGTPRFPQFSFISPPARTCHGFHSLSVCCHLELRKTHTKHTQSVSVFGALDDYQAPKSEAEAGTETVTVTETETKTGGYAGTKDSWGNSHTKTVGIFAAVVKGEAKASWPHMASSKLKVNFHSDYSSQM